MEENYLRKAFYYPNPDGLGYCVCMIVSVYVDSWYGCLHLDTQRFFRMHKTDLDKIELYSEQDMRPLEIVPELEAMLKVKGRRPDPNDPVVN